MVQGIGIASFIDLIAYILRRNIYRAGKVLGKSYKIFGNENLERLNSDSFKLVLFVSYAKKEDAFAGEICRVTDRICKEFMFGNFEYYEHVGGDCRLDIATFKEKTEHSSHRVVFAGPIGFEKGIKGELIAAGFNDKQFFYA